MTGPSATADIEGVLIHGAQGIRSFTVVPLAGPATLNPQQQPRRTMTWQQIYDPFSNMVVSTAFAAMPVVVMLVGLGFLHIKAHIAARARPAGRAGDRDLRLRHAGRDGRARPPCSAA